jgi:hypothetical protein
VAAEKAAWEMSWDVGAGEGAGEVGVVGAGRALCQGSMQGHHSTGWPCRVSQTAKVSSCTGEAEEDHHFWRSGLDAHVHPTWRATCRHVGRCPGMLQLPCGTAGAMQLYVAAYHHHISSDQAPG